VDEEYTMSTPTPRLRRLAVLTAVASTAVLGIVATGQVASAATAVTVTVHPGNGATLRDDFIGLSFEKNVLAGTPLSAGTLYQYMKTLGPGVVRFGGNFVDTTFWTSTGERAPSWAVATVTPADQARLGTLVQNSGWKVIYGVNLKHRDPARAPDEAAHASQVLGSSLIGIEVGNEPNYYPNYSPAKYWADFQAYRTAIAAAAPGVKVIGPSPGRVTAAVTWLNDFTSREQAAGVDLAALTTHYYPACAKTDTVTISSLLSTSYRSGEQARAQLLSDDAAKLGVRPLLDEANSVSCEGKDGVSDTYASALWAVDNELNVAQTGVKGMYFHSAIARCGAPKPLYKAYTPFCAATDADAAAGRLMAHPEYYGLLMLQQVGTGSFQKVDNSNLGQLRAYAIRNGTRLRLVLVNVSDSASAAVTVHLGGSYTAGTQLSLTGPSLAATTGLKLGGHTVGKGGTFAGTETTPVTVAGSTLTISVPAHTATLVTLTP
jgi:Glycosyl hydrolase family 79 C-terminal beta domain